MIKDALGAFASSGSDEPFFASSNYSYAADKPEVERSLAAFEESLPDADRRIQGFKCNDDSLNELATQDNEAESK